jgi:ribonuclease P protein component
LERPPKRSQANSLGHSFPKSRRLLKRPLFLRARRHKIREYAPLGPFDVHLSPNNLGFCRLGVIVTKKTGKAHVRNRLKRWAREFFRQRSPMWPGGADLVFLARVPQTPEPERKGRAGKNPRGEGKEKGLAPRTKASGKPARVPRASIPRLNSFFDSPAERRLVKAIERVLIRSSGNGGRE